VVFWSCTSDLGDKIWGLGFFFLLLWLLWLEHGVEEGATVSANKVGAADLVLLLGCCEAEPPLTGHGGEGEGRCFLRRKTELLLAGRGGEEER
jgi:hypothetical protein